MDTNEFIHRLKSLSEGKMMILVDDSKQLSEAAIICLAEFTSSEVVNNMVTHSRGMVSISMTKSIAEQAGLPPQKRYYNPEQISRNYTVSIDADETTTGISAQERSLSIKKLARTRTAAGFKQPGHIFPVIANERGLFGCVSVIEGAIDCAEIVGAQDAMVTVCDILDKDGMMGDASYSLKLAQNLQLPVVFMSELLKYKLTIDGLLTSKSKLSMNIDGCTIQIRMYELFGKCYEIFFNESDVDQVYKEILKTQQWLIDNPHDSLDNLPNYRSTASGVAKQLKNNQRLVIHGDLESAYSDTVYEMILSDLKNELKELAKELLIVTK
ncbi:3,4-dihydroxy-2-butanone-4-phosphate synthase [Bacillus sp. EB600]|uniref:3,4-dihydroxy-2-butanone-4-phosphate synthase n=1 Tax=Bacillus sp. EB600 TaxID=2806345 RepID=UPI00210C1D11|nr:3,4-dihydroxy-2-butanone-4-phosphate synthase [Bacillus sp. EB600]MCQ6282419.1 3,4-dihydroxy-2-butanone-4-phosphate synthase [Bacillus sp. EB600]